MIRWRLNGVFAVALSGCCALVMLGSNISNSYASAGAGSSPDEPMIQYAKNFDERGLSNDVMVQFGEDGLAELAATLGAERESFFEVELSALSGIESASAAAEAIFGDSKGARFMVSSRLDREDRLVIGDEHPLEQLQRYILVRYASPGDAEAAAERLAGQNGIAVAVVDRRVDLSMVPNDPYYGVVWGGPELFQWGMRSMRFDLAWNTTLGHAHVGVLDIGYEDDTAHPDIGGADSVNGNDRPQFFVEMPGATTFPRNIGGTIVDIAPFHGEHVSGIVAALANNNTGVAGGCPTCSLTMIHTSVTTSGIPDAIVAAVERGMQVLNMSFGGPYMTCSSYPMLCSAVSFADGRDVSMVAAAGNSFGASTQYPAALPSVLSVGGAEAGPSWLLNPRSWREWTSDPANDPAFGTSDAGIEGVVGPARSIVSTVPTGMEYFAAIGCGDNAGVDESGTPDDGYASCTGTSMASPHVAALVGLMRSIDPRTSAVTVANEIRDSGSDAGSPTTRTGHGLPHARDAVQAMLAYNPDRLTPLFGLFSSQRGDSLYTTSPQMASAATWGTLQPVNTPGVASSYVPDASQPVTGYSNFPDQRSNNPPALPPAPEADVWIFTTDDNPMLFGPDLVPLYRLSFKCGDPSPFPPDFCDTQPNGMDTAYASTEAQVDTYVSYGYRVDGIEGYIYPASMEQPSGTVRLLARYNRDIDDYAIFPEDRLADFVSNGWDEVPAPGGELGYVYRNIDGSMPSI